MNRHVGAIAGRLSLRPPQREALEILDRVADLIPLSKTPNLPAALATLRAAFPTVEDFERDFPSICFALATGVGKTRLMGAFISHLYLAKGIRHFFVLAPNLTIYDKLIADFTPNTPKYVFQGIAEFASSPPEIITGDNYENRAAASQASFAPIDVNIFNVSKINAEVRGGKAPRIKRLSEYIGESYFEYLSSLDDLVLLMDESHRYRADAGVRVLNELKPVLGLELTATPQVEQGAKVPVPFKNVIYSYPLSEAMSDGFVKEPAVATRENFDAKSYAEDELEQLKLEDGIRVHENTKLELELYGRQHGQAVVKPFMLVVAQDTGHANALVSRIEDASFFEGRYKGRVITVHSNQRGEERDETVARLLAVEKPDEPTEVVVHVNMLKEGWDVTNLYTIVPLRAANSRTLVEQSIGRGLRLPYGKRTGVPAVDRLTIVAHDRFQEILDEAKNPNSIIRAGVVIGRDIPLERRQIVTSVPRIDELLAPAPAGGPAQKEIPFSTPLEFEIARATREVAKRFENRPSTYDLLSPETTAQVLAEVSTYGPAQATLEGVGEKPDVSEIVKKTLQLIHDLSIDIPRIIVVPKGEVASGFGDFDLDAKGINLPPVEKDILLQYLRTEERTTLAAEGGIVARERLEDHLVVPLMDFDDICYDDHADLLYKLAGQAVRHLRSYLANDEEVANVLQYHRRQLVGLIHAQMQTHHWERPVGLEAHVSKGFTTLRPSESDLPAGEPVRNYRIPVDEKQAIRRMLFGGFGKCLYSTQKFDSDTERRFAVLLEDEPAVLKWFKPAPGQVRIEYRPDASYDPDFVVETDKTKYLCEPKRASEMTDPDVQAKATAAATWCGHATDHELKHGGKPWSYLLIPHDQIDASKTLAGLAASHTLTRAPERS